MNLISTTAKDSVKRAREIAKLAKSLYILGTGGRSPSASTPFTTRYNHLGSDCIGLVMWAWGVDRYQPKQFPLYDGWINTDSMLQEAAADHKWFTPIRKPFPGCAVVYPSIWKNGVRIRMGHIGLVTAVPAEWPDFALSKSDQTSLYKMIEVIDCNASYARRMSGRAVGVTNANWAWNIPDSKFIRFNYQASEVTVTTH